MKKLMIVLFIILLHCSEKESKQKEIVGTDYDDPSGKPYLLIEGNIKYNDNVYYFRNNPDSQMRNQVKNHEIEIQKFIPFADQFRKDIIKNDPKEIIKYFSPHRKQQLLKGLKEHCLYLRINDLTAERLAELYRQERLGGLERVLEYFYSGLTERKAPLILDTLVTWQTREEIYIVMIAPKYPLDYNYLAFYFKKKSETEEQFDMDGYGPLSSSYSRTYYDSSKLDRADVPDGDAHELLPSYRPSCFKGLQRK